MADETSNGDRVDPTHHDGTIQRLECTIDHMDDNVLQNILSFCSFQALCRSMRVNRRFRSLLASNDCLWKDILCQQEFWPWINPTSGVSYNRIPNWPRLLTLASHTCQKDPWQINEREIREHPALDQIECVQVPNNNNDNNKNDSIPAYRFTGTVGPGQRCIRADQPMQRPRMVRRGMQPHTRLLVPFVAPFCTNVSNNNNNGRQRAMIHLEPRWIAYFEITMTPSQQEMQEEEEWNRPLHRHHPGWRWRDDLMVQECTTIGLALNRFPFGRCMPGWDRHSFGYHGDDGCLYHNTSFRPNRSGLPTFAAGDTVGCGIDYFDGCIFFTLNGERLPHSFVVHQDMLLERDLYPVVGMDAKCLVTCNFGQRPFMFDLKSMIQKDRATMESVIQQLPEAVPYDSEEEEEDSDASYYSSYRSGSESDTSYDFVSDSDGDSTEGDLPMDGSDDDTNDEDVMMEWRRIVGHENDDANDDGNT